MDLEKEIRLQAALQLHDTGYGIVFVRPDTKAAKYPSWQVRGPPDRYEIQANMRRRLLNIGIRVQDMNLVVVDLDDRTLEWGRERGIDSPMICRTASGFHLYYRGTLEKSFKFEGGDVKATGYCMAPPSVVGEWRYSWLNGIVPPEKLPPYNLDLRPPEKPKLMPTVMELPESAAIDGMRKWIRRVIAEQGRGGDRDTFRVAIKIMSVINDMDQAMAEILAWDRDCAIPPWSDTPQGLKALEHKLKSARKYLNK
jgi:hypothetical protein